MLKILLFAIGLAQIAHSTYVEKNPSCAKGPSYWCQSVATSKECNAFKHCLQTVWTKHTDYLNSDEQLVDPNNPNPNKCTNCLQCVDARINYCPYVKDFTDEIDQLREGKLSPSSICKLLDQCKPIQIIDHGGLIAGEDVQIDPRFKCGLHPRQHCDNLDTATRCASTASCFNQWSQSTQKYVLKPQSGDENVDIKSQKTCGFCIFLFNKLHAALEQNDTEIDIEQYLMGACTLLPTKNESDMCNEAVQKYLPDIIKMVRNNLDPGIICRVLKLCDDKFLMPIEIESPVSEEEKLRINKELREFVEGIKVRVVNEDEAVIETPLTPKKQHLLGSNDETLVATLKQSMGVGCELCEIVLSAAKDLIQNKVDDQKVLAFINKELCSRLGAYKSACQDYVNLEGEEILSLLKKAIDPALICEMMGFCLKIQASNERLYDLNVRNGLNCTLCKMVFTEVKKKLGQHEEEERIINYINTNLCEKVGKSKEMCKTLMDAYGPLFLSIIARDINPGQVCEMIGMCSKADDMMPFVDIQPATTIQSSDTCVICEFVIKLLSDYVSKNTTEPEIEKLLEMVCTKLIPTSVRPQCNQFIQQYGPAVISLIINGVKPDQVCGFIGLCPKYGSLDTSSSRFFDEEGLFKHRSEQIDHQPKPTLVKIDSDRKNQTLQCSLCIYVAEVVDNLLKQNKTDDQITKEIELVCNLFPGDLRSQCKSFLDEYMPYILQLVAAELDAETTCAALKLCPKSIEQDIFRRSFVNKLPTKN